LKQNKLLVILFASFRNERLYRSWWHLVTGGADDVRVDRESGPCACEDRAGLARHRVVGHHTLEIGAVVIRLESLSAAFRLELTSVESGQ